MGKTISITGVESTGKSTLTNLLSDFYNTSKVPEYAREYLNNLNRDYTLSDVLKMAHKQLEEEQLALKNNPPLLFLDTDLLVFKIWIKEKYNQEIDWIEEHLQQASNKIYLLCDIDIPWEFDKLREHPNKKDRLRLFNEYKTQLEYYQLAYFVISGNIEERMDMCKKILN